MDGYFLGLRELQRLKRLTVLGNIGLQNGKQIVAFDNNKETKLGFVPHGSSHAREFRNYTQQFCSS